MAIDDLWYKNAVIYCLDVETFLDANGDGIGDFEGLNRRLDYLQGLGVTCVWLQPFYGSPNRDNGYDVADYYSVHPKHGTLGDFVAVMNHARSLGMRVLVDLVVNHTSTDHPWFQAARADPRSPYRDWYVWADQRPKNHRDGIVFPGSQTSNWTWDRKAGQYYFHRFYDHQPDLNTWNPQVRAEIKKIMGFWLELGVSGFRMDAVPFLIEKKGAGVEPQQDFGLLKEMRTFLQWRTGDAILLAEANVPPDESIRYFGDEGDHLQMMLNFPVNQRLFYAMATADVDPLARALEDTHRRPANAQWVQFLRSHDELDLGRLTDDQRQRVFDAFGPDDSMQLSSSVLALAYQWRSTSLVVLLNFASKGVRVQFTPAREHVDVLVDLFTGIRHQAREDGAHRLTLKPYAWHWLRVGAADNVLARDMLDLDPR